MAVEAQGPIAPSSESLTHYGIYMNYPNIGAVFHVHHNELWKYMINNDHDKTPKNIDYGTQEMAEAAKKCIGNKSKGIFVMEGHQDGIISYGSTPEEAGRVLLETLKESKN
jgi:L-ribulose-5-phosphate 4-epimerase